jgi:hypothetical protein
MDRFVNDENLERFRRLASAATSEAERKTLLGLLAEERAKFIEVQKAELLEGRADRAQTLIISRQPVRRSPRSLQVPDWGRSAVLAWPPRRPPLFSPGMVPVMPHPGNWHEVMEARDHARASVPKFGPWSQRKSHAATCDPLVQAVTHIEASSQSGRIAGRGLAFPTPTRPLNYP